MNCCQLRTLLLSETQDKRSANREMSVCVGKADKHGLIRFPESEMPGAGHAPHAVAGQTPSKTN